MISISFKPNKFTADLNNIVQYSVGFLEGVKKGKPLFFKNIGELTKDILENFIDSNSKLNPQMLHHVYEWYKTGSPDARLFDITYKVNNFGLYFSSSFKQSTSIKNGSKVPFYNKAMVIEQGIPVVITPKKSEVLAFEDNGETIFTKQPIEVLNPGGTQAQKGFEKTFDMFFNKYFSQAFLRSSGIEQYLKNPVVYKNNIKKGKKLGKVIGVSTGYSWIARAGYKT
jgi:hypothetical protein